MRDSGEAYAGKPTLHAVQWMRAAAALMVVVGHSQSAVALQMQAAGLPFARLTLLPWGAGVDLFFVISGFIMVHATRRLFGMPQARASFLRRRLTRIVPLYWLTTSLFLALLAAATWKGGDPFPSALAIVASYLFVPFDTWGDGRAFPVFDLGWTLNYEMAFYLLFAVAVTLPRRRAVGLIAALLVLAALAGAWVPADHIQLRVWTRPIILDFALGMAVGLAASETWQLSRPLRIALVAIGLALLAGDPMHVFNGPLGTTVANGWPRVAFAGLPAALALAGAVLGEPRGNAPAAPFAGTFTYLGDASYSLYLLHPFALIVMEKAVQKQPTLLRIGGGVLAAATIALALAVALAGYRWIERPITRWFADRRGLPAPPSTVQQGVQT